MEINIYSFKDAKAILQQRSPYLYDELIEILTELDIELWGKQNITKALKPLFQKRGWDNQPYVHKSNMRKRYDFGKGRVAVEVENSQYVRIYHDFLKFQYAYNQKLIDVGVLIVWGQKACHRMYRQRGIQGTEAQDAHAYEELMMMSDIFSVPILILGVEPNRSSDSTENTN